MASSVPARTIKNKKPASVRILQRAGVDDLDRSILDVLRTDPRSSVASVARKSGVTPATVKRRIDRLKRRGVLQFITAVDPEKVGYHVSAMIGLQVDLKKTEKIRQTISQLDEITYASAVLGAFDFLLTAVFETEDDLYRFLTETLAQIDGVQRAQTFRVLKVVKRVVSWGVAGNQVARRVGSGAPTE